MHASRFNWKTPAEIREIRYEFEIHKNYLERCLYFRDRFQKRCVHPDCRDAGHAEQISLLNQAIAECDDVLYDIPDQPEEVQTKDIEDEATHIIESISIEDTRPSESTEKSKKMKHREETSQETR